MVASLAFPKNYEVNKIYLRTDEKEILHLSSQKYTGYILCLRIESSL